MPDYREAAPFRHGSSHRTGLLLVNLGTPDAPTPAALKRYLREFLSDPRVVEIPRPVWWLILNGIILNVRPRKSAEKYASIWLPEGSPLKVHTDRLAEALGRRLAARADAPEIAVGMRYGNPSVATAMDDLAARGCDRIVVVPLYPQYAASTVGSTFDAVAAWGRAVRNLPAIHCLRNFHDDPGYIGALAASVRDHWRVNGGPGDMLVMSFHGLPQYTLREGDPYHCECLKTGRLLAEALDMAPGTWKVTFQSRFGKAEWLQPYTADTLSSLGAAGTRCVDVICPGFPADCLETLEEIAMEGKDTFEQAGGGSYRYIPCLNQRADWVEALAGIVTPLLDAVSRPPEDAATLAASRDRAVALGAAQ
jgi:ferrochelatase